MIKKFLIAAIARFDLVLGADAQNDYSAERNLVFTGAFEVRNDPVICDSVNVNG